MGNLRVTRMDPSDGAERQTCPIDAAREVV
jgi:hypothetical protein